MKLIVANWKMNLSLIEAENLCNEVLQSDFKGNKVVLCPPAPYFSKVNEITKGSKIELGSQDCHYEAKGAFTGDISSNMLLSFAVKYAIVGHSERRQHHFETDEIINKKAKAAISAGIIPIICVGEKLEQRKAMQHKEIVKEQLKITLENLSGNYVIAYEPVWAIGTGITASSEEIKEMHEFIKSIIPSNINLLYGGSVNDKNYHEILNIPNVDGLLIGGASLEIEKFRKIIAF